MGRCIDLLLKQTVALGTILVTLVPLTEAQTQTTLIDQGSAWKYLADGTLPAGWTAADYDDLDWNDGYAELGYGDGTEVTTIQETGDPVYPVYYFRHAFTVADPSVYTSLLINLLRDDGAIIYLNGVEVVRANVPDGDLTGKYLVDVDPGWPYVGDADETTYFSYALPADAPLQEGTNVLAVEMHQVDATSSDISFDLELIGYEPDPAPPAPADVIVFGPTVSTSPTLDLKVTDPEGQTMDVTFYGRETTDQTFTIVALPDTQNYSQSYPEIFAQQTQWIVDNKDTENIVFVTHEGDLVNTYSSETEWMRAKTAMSVLDGQVPYGMCLGNHDFDYGSDTATFYNQYFPYTDYLAESWYGGHYPAGANDNNYQLISALGIDMVVVHLAFWPDQDDIDWADDVFKAYPDRLGILTTHGFLDEYANRNVHIMGSTEYIWDGVVVPNDNVYLVLCGHVHNESMRADTVNGRTVYQVLADYQSTDSADNGGNGWLRLLQFAPAENKVYVRTYSPFLDQYQTDANSEFTMDIPLRWYTTIDQQTGVASGSRITTVWPDLKNQTSYEWFAWIEDVEGNISQSPLYHFTTQPASTADAVDDVYALDEDTLLQIAADQGVLINDFNSEGLPLINAQIVQIPVNGMVDLSTDGAFLYTPDPNFYGQDSFTYSAQDSQGQQDTATVTITVNPINDAGPVGVADEYTVLEDSILSIETATGVLANDMDIDGDPLTAELSSGPDHGILTLNADGSFSYTPDADFNGSDSFSYTANDGTLDSEPVTVGLTVTAVNDVPVAGDDSYQTGEDSPLVIDPNAAVAGVLANDSDLDGDSLTAVMITAPLHGTLTLTADGAFTYTPDADFFGPDSFTYAANDGTADSLPATVTVTVEPVNDPPVANDDATDTLQETAVEIAVLTNDTDPDLAVGDTIGVITAGTDDDQDGIYTSASGGTVSHDGAVVTYTPPAGYRGTDLFAYTIADTNGLTATAQVTVTVAENEPPVAAADAYAVNEDQLLDVASPGVLGNDTDPENEPLTASLATGVAHGTLILNADGSLTYTPEADYYGPDSFTYTAGDDTSNSEPIDVVITVHPVNDAPAGLGDSYTTSEDNPLTLDAAGGVLANDSDIDGDLLTAILVNAPVHGLLALNADGSFSYDPAANFNGTDGFTYAVSDGAVESQPVTVTITVTPVNDAPVAVNDSFSAVVDTPLIVDPGDGVLVNDTDSEADPLTAVQVSAPTYGSLSLNPDGSFIYTPEAGFTGTDSFSYTASDGKADSQPAVVTLTVSTQETVLFVDDFETGLLADTWSASAQVTVDGTVGDASAYGVLLKKSSTLQLDLSGMGLDGYSTVILSYRRHTEGLAASEHLTVTCDSQQLEQIGSEIATYTDSGDITLPAGTTFVQFSTDGNAGNDLSMIDNVKIIGIP